MGEPLCTYKLYSRFRDLSDIKPENRTEKIHEICINLPELNRNVFIFIIKFFRKVIDMAEFNKVSQRCNHFLIYIDYVCYDIILLPIIN